MKITTFNPLIATKDAESLVKLFEELGFERRHEKEGIGLVNATDYRMKDANGFYVDIVQVDAAEQDLTQIRMNVDNLDEAYELFTSHGFTNTRGDKITEDPTSQGAAMVAPSGFTIALSHHIKED